MHVYLWVRQLATGVMTAPAPDLHCYKVSGDVLRGFLTQICNCVFLRTTWTRYRMLIFSLQDGNSTWRLNSADRDQPWISRGGYTLLASIMGSFSVAAIILNVLVIVVMLKHRQLRQPLSFALVNLAVCDLGCALFGGLPTTVTSALGYFSLGSVGCTLEGFAVAFFGERAIMYWSSLVIHTWRIFSRKSKDNVQ